MFVEDIEGVLDQLRTRGGRSATAPAAPAAAA
jgi:hypothetical protein